MKVEIKKLPKSSIEVTVTVEKSKVKETYEHVLTEAVESTTVDGFRTGKAPREAVEQKVGVSKLYADVIDHLLQNYYPQALKENHVEAIGSPRVEIKEFDLEKDFVFIAKIPVKPEVKIGEYKSKIKSDFEKRQKELTKTNEEKIKNGEKIEVDHLHLTPNDVIEAIVEAAKVEVPETILDEETNRMMTRLVDQAQAIGLSLDHYLKSQNKSKDDLKKDYEKIAERNLVAEFALSKLVEDEKIEVTDEEVETTIRAAGTPNVDDMLNNPMQKLYVRMILQKNKLINNIVNEIQGEHSH